MHVVLPIFYSSFCQLSCLKNPLIHRFEWVGARSWAFVFFQFFLFSTVFCTQGGVNNTGKKYFRQNWACFTTCVTKQFFPTLNYANWLQCFHFPRHTYDDMLISTWDSVSNHVIINLHISSVDKYIEIRSNLCSQHTKQQYYVGKCMVWSTFFWTYISAGTIEGTDIYYICFIFIYVLYMFIVKLFYYSLTV